MTPEQARDVIAAAVQAAAVGIPTFYENADDVPVDSVGDFFLRVGFNFDIARQASIEKNPITRYLGEISLTHFVKSGQGTKALLARVGTLNDALEYRSLSGLQTAASSPSRKQSLDGWYSQEWVVPFWFHK